MASSDAGHGGGDSNHLHLSPLQPWLDGGVHGRRDRVPQKEPDRGHRWWKTFPWRVG